MQAQGSKVATIERRITKRVRPPGEDYVVYTGLARRIRDLSVGGVFIEDPDPLPTGSPILLELSFGPHRISCQGTVRRCLPRKGMGVQFRNLLPEMKDSLDKYVNALAKSEDQRQVHAQRLPPSDASLQSSETGKVAGGEELPKGQDLSAHLRALTSELRQVEEILQSRDVEHRVLEEFRAAVDQIRHSSWAAQQWVELQAQKGDVYSVLSLMVKDRVRRALQLGKDLASDIDAGEVSYETEGLKDLLEIVEALHQRLARFFKSSPSRPAPQATQVPAVITPSSAPIDQSPVRPAAENHRLNLINQAGIPGTVSVNDEWIGQWDTDTTVPLDAVRQGKNELRVEVDGDPQNQLTVEIEAERQGKWIKLMRLDFKGKPGLHTFRFAAR